MPNIKRKPTVKIGDVLKIETKDQVFFEKVSWIQFDKKTKQFAYYTPRFGIDESRMMNGSISIVQVSKDWEI